MGGERLMQRMKVWTKSRTKQRIAGGLGLSALDHDRLEQGVRGRIALRQTQGETILRRRRGLCSGLPKPGRDGIRRFAQIVLFASLVLPLGLPSLASAEEFEGYVKSTALNVREQPGVSSAIAGILLKYDPVRVKGEERVGKTRWLSIEASGGYVKGWVSARFIERGTAPAGTQDAEVDYGAKHTPTLMPGPFQYVGVRACAECHDESTGAFDKGAVPVWEAHFHSQAQKTLERDYTREIAQRTRGVEDPATDWRCVKCHQAAYGADPAQIASIYRPEDGVSCEVCHGPGSGYVNEDHGPDVANRDAMGFRVLRDLSDRREVCTSCHNSASPTFIGFDLREFSRKIAHWVDKDDADYYAEADRETAKRAERMDKAAEQVATKKMDDGKSKAMAGAGAVIAGGAAAGAAGASAAGSTASGATSAAKDSAKAAEEAARAAKAEAAANAANAAEKARAEQQAAKARADAAAKAKSDAAAKAKADAAAKANSMKAEAARLEALAKEEEEALRKAEARRIAEEVAATRSKAEAKKKQAMAAATPADPLAKYLEDVDDKVTMNTDGEKYKKFKFSHKKHATGEYFADVQCRTCHHTQEGDDSPVACNECHNIGGDADEEKAKKKYVHTKGMSFPMEDDQEQISCVSCHKVMNDLYDEGERKGKKAPVKCTACHARDKS